MSTPPALVEARGISKRFGITRALDGVSVSFRAGEVHALMGENGAGKSTLGKIIAGLHKQDAGDVVVDGRTLRPGSIDDAFRAGVRIVHQELAQCPNLSVAENLCLHDIPRTRLRLVDNRAMIERAERLVHALEPRIDVEAPLGSLSPGWRQICQIAQALDDSAVEKGAVGPRVIVLDEPTSSLSAAEVDRLLEIVRALATRGLTLIYVSHRMGEIFACCDRVSVLRDGRFIATSDVTSISEGDLVEQMIGRCLEPGPGEIDDTPGTRASTGDSAPESPVREVLAVTNLSSPGRLSSISLTLRAGEILGVAGLVGAGRSELLDAIFGLDSRAIGEVRVLGKPMRTRDPRERIDAGVGYVPEDRRLQGLFFDLSVQENTVLPRMGPLAGALGLRGLARERDLFARRREEFRVKAASPSSLPGQLSGGNQQKLLLARWMGEECRVLLLDEPTRGIDVATKAEIHRAIRAAARRGVGVLLVSSEMPELLSLSHRVIVLSEGRTTGELAGDQMTQRNILTLATRESAALA